MNTHRFRTTLFSLSVLIGGLVPAFAVDTVTDNLTVNTRAGIGTGLPSLPYRLTVGGWVGANNFYVFGPHVAGETEYLRENANSTATIFGAEIRNWSGGVFGSGSIGNCLVLMAGSPAATDKFTALMDNSSLSAGREMRLGSYSFSNADIVLYPGEVKTLVAKASGRVGIGTITPTARLSVEGNSTLGVGLSPLYAEQTIVGKYNDTRTSDGTTNHLDGLFIVGSGTNTTTRQNAIRVLNDGTTLVRPAGDIAMGIYTSGPQP